MTTLVRDRPETAAEMLDLGGDLALKKGRVHEIAGPSRLALALWTAGRTDGEILWVRLRHHGLWPNPAGIVKWLNPGRILYVNLDRAADLLWCMEEGLRAGICPLVIADLPEPPPLTPVRRLNLAAEEGARAECATCPPLGLILTPGEGGAPGVESRWVVTGDMGRDREGWTLRRTRARMAPEAVWTAQYRGSEMQIQRGVLS